MKKIIDKKNNNFLNYKNYLKNNNLNKKNQLNKNLFENHIILKNKDNSSIELNKNENFFLPKINKEKIVYTILSKYENNLLINYNLNYNLLHYLTKLFFQNYIKKKGLKIKGRIINIKKKKILVSIFGLIFQTKFKDLQRNKKIFYIRKIKLKKRIYHYKIKRLTFQIDKNLKNKKILSRKTYVQEIIDKQKKKFQEKVDKRKKIYATI